jgi:hypothetical protein
MREDGRKGEGPEVRCPQLNSLRSFSSKNLTGQTEIGDQGIGQRSQRSEGERKEFDSHLI